jgi:nucleoside-diphosphate-sugar epimerase
MGFSWSGKPVLVTGGASFISSHLVDSLVTRGATVRVVDDLSSGRVANIQSHIDSGAVEFIEGDLRDVNVTRRGLDGIELVFHMSCDHGGRGYVNTYQAGPATNLHLDGVIFWESVKAKVDKVVFASSACVYPNFMQMDTTRKLYLSEEMVGPAYDADNMYGWSKLMAEFTLRAYHKEFGLKAAPLRFFTVYGPRAKEDHAVIAMIARNYIKQDPIELWGTGEQLRCWTYVDDIVRGLILAAEKIDDATPINLGTPERIRVLDAMKFVMAQMGHKAEIKTRPEMPCGPLNRVADVSRAKELLGWEPAVLFEEGVRRTIDWYTRTKTVEESRRILQGGGLVERQVSTPAGQKKN